MLARHVLAVPVARFERVRERADPALEARQHVAAAAGSDVFDLVGQRAHLVGEFRQRVVGGDVRDDAAHGDDRAFELLERRRVLAAAADHVDLARELLHRLVDADQALGRRQAAQRVAHLHEPALDAGDRAAVDARVAGVVDAFGELAHLAFERLDRLARHGVLQHDADLGEVVAQRVDRLADRAVDVARPAQRLDLGVDLAQLPLEAGELLGAGARQRLGRRGRRHGGGRLDGGGRLGSGGRPDGGRGWMAVERALAVGDLHQRLIERGRRVGGHGRTGLLLAEIGHHAVDRAHAPLDFAGGGAPLGNQLVEPAVELGYGIGELTRRFVLAAGGGLRVGDIEPRQLVELPRQVVEALIDLGDARVGRGALARAGRPGGVMVRRGLGAVVAGHRPMAAVVVGILAPLRRRVPVPIRVVVCTAMRRRARAPVRCLHGMRNR